VKEIVLLCAVTAAVKKIEVALVAVIFSKTFMLLMI
jgi:hypothetical protein